MINMESLKEKARNYFILAVIAESLNMPSEAATNYFKSLFAIDDSALFERIRLQPKDHTERFEMLKRIFPKLYIITDRLFSAYRRTYTQELEAGEVRLIKTRIMEAFRDAGISIPTNEEIKAKFEELAKKGKFLG